MGMLLISVDLLDPIRKLLLFQQLEKGMDDILEEETSYTTQYREAFLKYVENKYCAILTHLPIIKPKSVTSNNLFPSPMAFASGQSSIDPSDLSSDDGEYFTPGNVVQKTPGRSDCATW